MKKRLLSTLICIMLALLSVTASAAADKDLRPSTQTNLTQINYFPVWEQGFDGTGVTIAVIDSGVRAQHEELRDSNILTTVNMLHSGSDEDSDGHGTFITSMLAAARGNGAGIDGMVDGARILPFKCFADVDSTTYLDYIVRAVYSAVDDYGCDVINISLVGDRDDTLRAAIDHAVDKGVIVVSSVGNDGGDTMYYPAAYDNVVGVGSVDGNNNVSNFSQRNESVFVVAPGEQLTGAYIESDSSYISWDGTSFSCVHVTALAAVAKQYDRSIDAAHFMELLRSSAVDLGPDGYDTSYGWGLVDAGAFLDAMYAEKKAADPDLGRRSQDGGRGSDPDAPAVNAVLSPQRLAVDGKRIECEMYNIGGKNYLKLRDLAYLLNGTGSQFEVNRSQAASALSITTGAAYTPIGTELTTGADNSGTARPGSQAVWVNGTACGELTIYNIGGSSFFQLRELGKLLDFEVGYDASSNTVAVRSAQKQI